MRALWTVLISVICALTWYRQHLKFQNGRGFLYRISPEYGEWILPAAMLLIWATFLVIGWRDVSASPGTGKPGPNRDNEE
jgi:hypothetical protein